jgi:hypothetical protein
MSAPAKRSAAVLERRVVLLEAKLAVITAANHRLFCIYSDQLHEIVELKLRQEAALAALAGVDYFGGEK